MGLAEEKVRLRFLTQREALERTILQLGELAGRLDTQRRIVFGGKIEEFESLILELIDEREKAALRKAKRRDPTESTITARDLFASPSASRDNNISNPRCASPRNSARSRPRTRGSPAPTNQSVHSRPPNIDCGSEHKREGFFGFQFAFGIVP